MQQFIYFNGELIDQANCRLRPNDRGLLLGDGLFETIRIYQGSALFLEKHWKRLSYGASILDIAIPFTFEKLKTIIDELLVKNNLHHDDALIRLTLTRGEAPRELWPTKKLTPTVLVTVFPYQALQKNSISAMISHIPRNEGSPLAQIKSLNYLDNILARREAVQAGFDEAILLNTKGKVAEAATANIFIVKENKIFTPPITEGALSGVMRQVIFELAAKLNLKLAEKIITIDELMNADEIFLTNVNVCILPIAKIGDKVLTLSPPISVIASLRQGVSNHVKSKKNYTSHRGNQTRI